MLYIFIFLFCSVLIFSTSCLYFSLLSLYINTYSLPDSNISSTSSKLICSIPLLPQATNNVTKIIDVERIIFFILYTPLDLHLLILKILYLTHHQIQQNKLMCVVLHLYRIAFLWIYNHLNI